MGAGMTQERPALDRGLLALRVGAVVAAWVWWALAPSAGWVVMAAAVPVLVGVARAREVAPSLLSICMGVFLATGVVALWATYDQDATRPVFAHPVGWQKLWGLILAALFFYALVTIDSATERRWAAGLLAGLGALVAAGFVATNDWTAQPALWEPITGVGEALQGLLPPLPRGALNPNVAGGVVAPLLPLSIGLTVEGRRMRQRLWVTWGLLTAAAMAAALLLTTSRGAWLGTAGAFVLAAVWWTLGRMAGRERQLSAFLVTLGVGAVAAVLAFTLLAPLRNLILGLGPVENRLAIFSQAALLFRDYAFTGSGLGTFPLTHSTYVLLIHVAELSHAHALPLNVAVEQGIMGVGSLLLAWGLTAGLGLRTLARSERERPMLAAALMSLGVLVIHGFADDALYSSRGLLFLWAPVAMVVAAARRVDEGVSTAMPPASGKSFSVLPRWVGIATAVLTASALLVVVWRPVAASFYANLGAVRQTLVELRTYDPEHFSDLTLDQVRRQENLVGARRHFERAVELDPGQVTGRTRLSQIALARGDYTAALEHAQAAWRAGHRDRVTRLVLGDALVAQGRIEEAAALVKGLEFANSRLQGQASLYRKKGDWQRVVYALRTVLVLDPGNERVRNAAVRAERKTVEP